MQSNNPVFRRSEGFGQPSHNAYGNATYGGNGAPYAGYGQDPSQWSTGGPQAPTVGAPMTIDSVVQKTAISVGLTVLAAIATWMLTPEIAPGANLGPLYAATAIGSIGGLILGLVNSFKRVVSPALVLAYAVLQGMLLGGISKTFDAMFGGGIVVQAVLGTFAAFAGVLAAYKFFDIKVGAKFRTFMMAAGFGLLGLILLEVVLGLFGGGMGLFGMGPMGLVFSIAGLAFGIFSLILDFDFVEQGVANQLEERESWRAAFALTASLVMIYFYLLRILAILQQD
ncbi:Bax inhibitor-1/YccA family membrane protein [Nocardioides albus]|uniref:Putative YccA/Bax inhibitor family protein n=1 Tax=Nocardioides albus TaxID=1841 RepID=A0A7W5A060_9ACTN|nr:Bax inhibitor-1/YccA family protein [Nocardioides albus]MBB3087108.1 putative YccA/Bax inhibitor family protein [Nocardioides albus]GGU06675.1 membrane protein [Nocardioides albus]